MTNGYSILNTALSAFKKMMSRSFSVPPPPLKNRSYPQWYRGVETEGRVVGRGGENGVGREGTKFRGGGGKVGGVWRDF